MALTLSIQNETSLPDGGPLSVTVTGKRGIDIGRDQHLDWTLPDPTRVISGKHCEVRYKDGAYWLFDVSTNGTFLNGSDRRIQAPHRLRHGDRIDIGHYIVAAAVEGEDMTAAVAPEPGLAPNFAHPQEMWGPVGEAAPPGAARDFKPPQQLKPVKPDFLDWAVDTPHDVSGPVEDLRARPPVWDPPPPAPRPRAADEMSWAQGPPPAPPPPEPPMPMPRRPASLALEDDSPWGTPSLVPPAEPRPQPAFEALPTPTVSTPEEFAPPPRPTGAPAGALSPDFVRRLAKGAGVPEEVFARRDPGELAEELGALMRLVVTDLKQLLTARAESKRMARSSNQTTIQALDNNPLKFSPTPEDALRIMFGPSSAGYLDARRSFEQSFKDLKVHQVKTYSAMQHALRMLVEDLDPQVIDETTEKGGLGSLIGSRKAKMWETYVARWDGMTAPHDDGMVDAFMLYFAECYDRGGGGR